MPRIWGEESGDLLRARDFARCRLQTFLEGAGTRKAHGSLRADWPFSVSFLGGWSRRGLGLGLRKYEALWFGSLLGRNKNAAHTRPSPSKTLNPEMHGVGGALGEGPVTLKDVCVVSF